MDANSISAVPYDAIIVGGSYAGLSAALQLARARRRVLIIDSGLPRNRFAPAAHGFFGQDGRPPYDILRDASRQIEAYPTVTLHHGEAVDARPTDGGFALSLADGHEAQSARLILATGVRDEFPALPGLRERWGVTVLHCPYCHGYEAADRPIGLLARRPAAVQQALLLPDWGPTTYFTQNEFEPSPQEAAQMAARGVRIERSPIVELLGSAPGLDAVRLADGRITPLGALYTWPDTRPASTLAEQLGCALDDGLLGPFIRTDDEQRTTVPGVYAAGDSASQAYNATLASAAGVMAGVGAHKSLVFEAAAPPRTARKAA